MMLLIDELDKDLHPPLKLVESFIIYFQIELSFIQFEFAGVSMTPVSTFNH